MNNKFNIITIDGLAASGKSSIAKLLAEKLNYIHLNSGLLYRAVSYLSLEYINKNNLDIENLNEEIILDLIKNNKIYFKQENTKLVLYINENNPGKDLFSEEVAKVASIVSAKEKVRKALMDLQRELGKTNNLVAEGRDMGTVVFPNADCKFFIEVDVETRAQRRLSQADTNSNTKNDDNLLKSLENDIKKEIIERDERDKNREISPAKPAEDAIIINNSSEELTQVVKNIYDSVLTRLK
ncbi:UNVERIFIED_CONTAM: hypothetical protein GTU68_051090 [Idotea baltica]|nr:hypothetical protein [Idotea baltica]